MSALQETAVLPPVAPWPTRRLWRWGILAMAMFRRAPLTFLGLCLLPMLVEGLVQVAIPVAGIVLSKFLVPLVAAWCLVMTDHRVRGERLAPGAALRRLVGVRWPLLGLAMVAAAAFGLQMLVVTAMAGFEGAKGFMAADPAVVGQFTRAQIAFVLASGAAPAMLLFFTGPRVLLDGVRLWPALRENARLLGRGWRPLGTYMLITAMLVAAIIYVPWVLLLVLPMGYLGYWAYRDVFDQPAAD